MAAIEYRLHPRHTVDIDCVVNHLGVLVEELERRGIELRVLREEDGSPYLVQGTTPDGMHFDVYVAGTRFEQSVLARRNERGYVSPEDLIVYKLMAWRSQDRDDIAEVLAADLELDTGYIEHWAGQWEVLDRWQEALGTANGGQLASDGPGAWGRVEGEAAAEVVEAAYPQGFVLPGPAAGAWLTPDVEVERPGPELGG